MNNDNIRRCRNSALTPFCKKMYGKTYEKENKKIYFNRLLNGGQTLQKSLLLKKMPIAYKRRKEYDKMAVMVKYILHRLSPITLSRTFKKPKTITSTKDSVRKNKTILKNFATAN